MGWAGAIVVFVVGWWLSLFMVLPIGIRSQVEAGEVADGTEPSAPAQPMMWKKARWATYGAAGITAAAAIVIPLLAP